MLKSAFTLARMPGALLRDGIRRATSPSAINTLSVAIAQGSIQASRNQPDIEIEGLDIQFDFNEERLLATAGVSTAIAFGTLYWLGSRLNLQVRYARIVDALQVLDVAIKADDKRAVQESLDLINDLTNPLKDPSTLQPIEASDEVKSIYELVIGKPATNGSMFNASTLTNQVDEAVEVLLKTGSRGGLVVASEVVEESIEAMTQKAGGLAGRGVARAAGRLLWVDTIYWLGTSALDIGLDFLGIPEEKQRIPFLADIPFIGGLFDLSDSFGASAVDLLITPIFDAVFGLLGLEEEAEDLMESLWTVILSAALNPSITPFIIAIMDFYIDDVEITFDLDLLFDVQALNANVKLDLLNLAQFDPIDVLVLWTYAIMLKVVFKVWLKPALDVLKR